MLATWNKLTNPVKIVIVVVLLVIFCCCSFLIFGSVLNAGETPAENGTVDVAEIQTQAVQTVQAEAELTEVANIPTNTLQPTETSTPLATSTPAPTVDPYFIQVMMKFSDFQNYYDQFNTYQQEAAADPSLILDDNWKTKMGLTMGFLNIAADEMAKLQPTPSYEQFHFYIQGLAAETNLMTTAYARGIDNLDSASIQQAVTHLLNMTSYIESATTELERIQSQP